MYLNKYSARVVGGYETPSAYVELRHGQTYQLQLRNDNNSRCDAQVEIDGKTVGVWRLNSNQSVTLERPANDNGKFTFYKAGTAEAQSAQLDSGDFNLGLIRVTFTPEQEVRPVQSVSYSYTTTYGASAGTPVYRGLTYTGDTSTFVSQTESLGSASKSLSAGGTGLSGHSNQNFDSVAQLDYDYSGQTVIHLRLVCKEDDGPRPLTQYSTPVPPRIG